MFFFIFFIYIYIFFYTKTRRKKLQIDGASRWRVCYQRGLPRLVYVHVNLMYGGVKVCSTFLFDWVLYISNEKMVLTKSGSNLFDAYFNKGK